jgi:hypothetical protein
VSQRSEDDAPHGAEPDTAPGRYAGAAEAHLDLRHHLSYAEYLGLDDVLTAQRPRTDAHDEMLFIVQHQATELWL